MAYATMTFNEKQLRRMVRIDVKLTGVAKIERRIWLATKLLTLFSWSVRAACWVAGVRVNVETEVKAVR